MVELKNGETYSGVLASCDGFMNLFLGWWCPRRCCETANQRTESFFFEWETKARDSRSHLSSKMVQLKHVDAYKTQREREILNALPDTF